MIRRFTLPIPMFNVIMAVPHADMCLDFQEYMLLLPPFRRIN